MSTTPDHTDACAEPHPAIAQALHLIATSPLGSDTQRAAVEILGCYLRIYGPAAPCDEAPDALNQLSAHLVHEIVASGAVWAANGIGYASMYIDSITNRASAGHARPRPHPQAVDASSESKSRHHPAPAQEHSHAS